MRPLFFFSSPFFFLLLSVFFFLLFSVFLIFSVALSQAPSCSAELTRLLEEEVCSLLRPPSPSHFCCQDNKSRSALSATELRVSELLPSTSSLQNSATNIGATGGVRAPPQRRDQRPRRSVGPRCDVHRAGFGTTMSRSWILKFVVTLPPASRHTRAAADSTANPRLPRTLDTAHAARWWHWNRVDGHTGKHGWTRTEGATSGRRRRVGKTCASNVVCLATGQHVWRVVRSGSATWPSATAWLR